MLNCMKTFPTDSRTSVLIFNTTTTCDVGGFQRELTCAALISWLPYNHGLELVTPEPRGWVKAGLECGVGRLLPCSWLTSTVRSPNSQSNFHPLSSGRPLFANLFYITELKKKGSPAPLRCANFCLLFKNQGKLTASRTARLQSPLCCTNSPSPLRPRLSLCLVCSWI